MLGKKGIKMKFKLNEHYLLLEGKNIDTLWSKYSNKFTNKVKEIMPPSYTYEEDTYKSLFSHLVSNDFDPTFDSTPENTSGDYGEWLVNQFIKNDEGYTKFVSLPYIGFKLDSKQKISNPNEFIGFSIETTSIKELLKCFDTNKKYIKNADINSYKTVKDIINAIESAAPSKKQAERLRFKRANDIKVLFKGENYTVVQPQSWEAEVLLARGSGWCTTHSDPSVGLMYYNRYTNNNKDKLTVIIPNEQLSDDFPFNQRHDWLQVAPYSNAGQGYAWGYIEGKQSVDAFTAEDSADAFSSLDGIQEWIEENPDVSEFLEDMYPNKGFDGTSSENRFGLEDWEYNSPTQTAEVELDVDILEGWFTWYHNNVRSFSSDAINYNDIYNYITGDYVDSIHELIPDIPDYIEEAAKEANVDAIDVFYDTTVGFDLIENAFENVIEASFNNRWGDTTWSLYIGRFTHMEIEASSEDVDEFVDDWGREYDYVGDYLVTMMLLNFNWPTYSSVASKIDADELWQEVFDEAGIPYEF